MEEIYTTSRGDELVIKTMDDWHLVNALAQLSNRIRFIEKIKNASTADKDNRILLALKNEIISRMKK